MALVGVVYLLFERAVLSPSEGRNADKVALGTPSKAIIGMQIGLILLSMIVTRSSAASLQAKQGLPLGNQVVGWIVLGKYISIAYILSTD